MNKVHHHPWRVFFKQWNCQIINCNLEIQNLTSRIISGVLKFGCLWRTESVLPFCFSYSLLPPRNNLIKQGKDLQTLFPLGAITSLSTIVSCTGPFLLLTLWIRIADWGSHRRSPDPSKNKKKCICLSKAQSAASGERVARVDRTSSAPHRSSCLIMKVLKKRLCLGRGASFAMCLIATSVNWGE